MSKNKIEITLLFAILILQAVFLVIIGLPEIVSIKEILLSLAAIITSIVAIMGLNIWRSQLKGTNEYQLAIRILQNAYEFEETLRSVRSPFVSASELSQRKKILKKEEISIETEREASILDESYAYFERFKSLQKISTQLKIVKYEAAALWRKENVKYIEDLIGKEKEIYINYDMHFRGKMQGWEDKEERQKYYEVLYYMGEGDKFNKEIANIINKIEESLRKYI